MARGIVIQIEGDGASAQRALQMVQEEMRHTREASETEGGGIERAMERVKTALEFTGIYFGIREVIEGVKELVGGSLELGEALEKAGKRTGLTAESLSVLHYAASVTGSDFDGLTAAIAKMDTTIAKAADGDKKAEAFMRGLGLNAKELTKNTNGSEIAFQAFLKSLAATESPMERNRLAMGLLGKAGIQQIPVLLELAENWDFFKQKAQDAGVLLNGETAAALADANQRMNDLKQHVEGAGLAFTEGLSPGLGQFLGILSGGKSQMESMKEWGQDVAKIFALVGEVAYSAAAAAEFSFSAIAGGKLTEAGRRDWEAALRFEQKAKELYDMWSGKTKPSSEPFIPHPVEAGGRGFEGAPSEEKGKSEDPIARAQAEFIAEQGKLAAAAVRMNGELQLAETDAQHKMLLISDEDYYAKRLELQNANFDAEESALRARQQALQDLLAKEKGDKKVKRDKDGNSAEQLRTQRELLEVQKQMQELTAKRGQAGSEETADIVVSQRQRQLAALKVAAELEKERNAGITQQIALIQREQEIKAKDAELNKDPQSAAEYRALGEIEAKKLEIGEVTRQITSIEDGYKLKVEQVRDAVEKGQISKFAGAAQINKLNKQEADALQALVEQYDALAQVLGGQTLENAKNLHAELDKLNRPDRREDAQFGKIVSQGVSSMAETIAEQAVRGKTSFKEMVTEMEADAVKLVAKLAVLKLTKLLEQEGGGGDDDDSGGGGGGSFLSSIFGALGEHHMSGGLSSGGPQVVGEAGPELWTPPQRGGTVTPSNMLTKLAESGGSGRAPNVTQNIVNQSSQPVTASQPQVRYDAQLREFHIHTFLTDLSSNGPMSQALNMGGQ